MSFSVHQDSVRNGGQRLALSGRLDSTTAPQFEQSVGNVLGSPPAILVFDMAGLEYISSAGLRIIFKLQKAVKGISGEVMMVNLQPPVRKVFEIIDALPSLSVFSSVAELDDYLDHMQAKEIEKHSGG